jgi:phenylpropionate dioxygenase-like ring-hydroxylating dioxygenase large terminal subunit
MLTKEENEMLTRVGPGTPMGELFRRYWVPAAFSHQVPEPDCSPIRVKLLCENLVLFRDTSGKVGLVDERCPHRTASMFFGRNEQNGLRCVYHGLKFDVVGNCVDVPCVKLESDAQMNNVKRALKIKAYPCIERGGLVWAYMGPPELKPDFPDLEWTMVPESHRFSSRHIQECNWLQALDGAFDASHLAFLHSGTADLRKGKTDHDRRIVPSVFEILPTKSGFLFANGRELTNGNLSWHVGMMILPFHKIVPSVPLASHVYMPIDDENTMYYSFNFHPDRPLTDEDLAREKEWRGIHTKNIPGTDYAVANRANDYLIDRELQASGSDFSPGGDGKSFTGIFGLCIQDCGIQESMGPIADRTLEHLLASDIPLVRIRRRLLETLKDHAEGKPLPGIDPKEYRVRATRFEAPKNAVFAEIAPQKCLDIRLPVPV